MHAIMISSPQRKNRSLAACLLLGLIDAYQLTLSAVMGRRCRYLPSCAEYTGEAVARFGAWRGFWFGLARISRCHPWGGEGFDPVPSEVPLAGWRFWRFGRWRVPKQIGPEN